MKKIALLFAIFALMLGLAVITPIKSVYAGQEQSSLGISYSKFVNIVNNYRQQGNPNANITIIVYSDYECPWCRLFEEKDLNKIITSYVNSGKIFIEYRDFPLTHIHQYAFKAAEYADCSALQGKYLSIRSLLYKDQSSWHMLGDFYYFLKMHSTDPNFNYRLNLKKEQKCVKSGYANKLIRANMASGQKMGVTGTPTIFIYQGLILYKKITGYRPYPKLNAILRNALK